MLDWCRENDLLRRDSIFMGMHHDDWDEDDPDGYERYCYDAAVVIDSGTRVGNEVNTSFVPGGEVAVVRFEGSLNTYERVWRTFVYEWLPASGYQPRLSFMYDIYDTRLAFSSKLGQIIKLLRGIKAEFCIPISRLPLPISRPN